MPEEGPLDVVVTFPGGESKRLLGAKHFIARPDEPVVQTNNNCVGTGGQTCNAEA